ncbi:class I SAM-dependent methyltransferase [Aquisalimonas lutea]|uniref:class I SAM-dependent methyltransferase n=1 Tax=Aquisalimonas lutea TaxID=1327750 RepID=UPI0025B4AC99|nr:class I SAM-dependent methyltransferase [Aquisalimonas lutea]MDN3518048.1 class I SAM-dependent methyltransferase [Aquisalimonas lutea]
MTMQSHWEAIYRDKAPDEVSWYRPHLETSLRLIREAAPDRAAPIIDVGGGESTLVDDLLAEGYRRVTVLDLSRAAVDVARQRLGERALDVDWQVADITGAALPEQHYAVWHDRAVFHFLVDPGLRAAYVRQALGSLTPGGSLIMATFGPQGPEQCSGLDVVRYDAATLHEQLGPRFALVEHITEDHVTPAGTTQQFLYAHFRLRTAG